jgi:hypothetical protein
VISNAYGGIFSVDRDCHGINIGDQMHQQLQTPVIFIVFNRPLHTRASFARIAQAKPSRLLVIADGPRTNKIGEFEVCEEVRKIATAVDWPCQVEINFSSANMGCCSRVVSGLNWAFKRVDEAIILEDDVLPDPTFFPFCEQMLQHYRGNSRISMITGCNFVQDHIRTNYSYFFSRLTHIWGWATWRESWALYDQHLKDWPEIKQTALLQEIFDSSATAAYWSKIFDSVHDGSGPDTWDYQWTYTNLIQNTLSIVPRVNLVENIGFGVGATHTVVAGDAYKLTSHAIEFPLIRPPAFVPLRSMDRKDLEILNCYIPTLPQRIMRKLRNIVAKTTQKAHGHGTDN